MKSNFTRAKCVIEALLPIAEKLVNGPLDEIITTRLKQLSRAYGGQLLEKDRNPVDYSKTTTHIAYAYRCLSAHGDWLYQTLDLARDAVSKGIDVDSIKVACVGGGPGSDILGVTRFCAEAGLGKREFEFVVLDRELTWARCRKEVVKTYKGEMKVSSVGQPLDLTADGAWTDDWQFLDADIITFSFSLSEVWSFNTTGSVSRFVDRILTGAKKGCIICYMDNGGKNFIPLMEQEFGGRQDLKLLGSKDVERINMSSNEQCNVIKDPFSERFGGESPKLVGNLSMRVWKKR